jgi:hypothetical protein
MKIMTEPYVISKVVTWLSNEGYRNIKPKTLDEHGVDIIASKEYGRFVYIECKGEPKGTANFRNSQIEASFVYAIGQIATRMSRGYQSYGLAFPESYRSKLKRIPWLFAKRNNVFILLIDKDDKVKKYSWKDLKKYQM